MITFEDKTPKTILTEDGSTISQIQIFEDIRQWRIKRGITTSTVEVATEKFREESQEVFDAVADADRFEAIDGMGDSVVTLVGIATAYGLTLEECIYVAFKVIKHRKGITRPSGDFVRYAKLSDEEKIWCDKKQGNAGQEHSTPERYKDLTEEHYCR